MDEREKDFGYLFNKVTQLIKWELNVELKDFGLTSAQWAVIADLYQIELTNQSIEKSSPALIAERLKVERPAVTRIIDTLLKNGFVRRQENPLDRRVVFITLTEKSRDIIPMLKAKGKQVVDKTFHTFDEDEIFQLRKILLRIIENYN